MTQQFTVSNLWIASAVAAILFDILYPIGLALLVRRRLGVGWRYFGYGALIFALFQILTRVPAVQLIQAQIAPQLQESRPLLFAWLAALSLSAGVFEEVGRYVGYRWLMRREEKTWSKAVMYGVGHGGIEAMVLVAGLALLGLVNLVALSSLDLSTLPISDEQRAQVEAQLAAVQSLPGWTPLLGAWERLWTVPFHVMLSVLVLQVFRRAQIWWLLLAIGVHALLNLAAVGLPEALGLEGLAELLLPEAIIAVAGLVSVWVVWRLRDEPREEPRADA
ncbi:MAG: YhfC family glutamic-type intramembrane protease [Chloroflexota bacterium]